MICCNEEIIGLYAFDDGIYSPYAFNLGICDNCGKIYKEDVWENKGIMIIDVENNISRITLKDR